MGRSAFLYAGFVKNLGLDPTECQDRLFKEISEFVTSDEDCMVVNGYAGTGKTTALASVIRTLNFFQINCVLLAPTGRAAKVLSSFAGMPAYTIHKKIYRQKSLGSDGFGEFSLAPNEMKNSLFIVDEASLIGVDNNGQSLSNFGTGNLLEDLLSYVRRGVDCKIIFVGDTAQLPPIGQEQSPALSHDYMAMLGASRFATLKTVVRQQGESGILWNATHLRELITEGRQLDDDGFSGSPGMESIPIDELGLISDGFPDVVRITGGELIEALSDAYSRYGEDETVVLCRSNKRANRYNAGIRSSIQYKEERLVRGDKLMIVKNCYQFVEDVEGLEYIANGDIAKLMKISRYEDRYGLHFAEARLALPDYDNQEIVAKVILDTLDSESASLTYDQQQALYQGVNDDYRHINTKRKRYEAVREDKFFNALQLKYANAITCHKSQGGQWSCVFIDNPFWQDELTAEDLRWLYTAITRGVEKVYLVNFKDEYFQGA
ncbi:MAG: AAA family ATPase [Bacteroidales bacterium]|nr:AAA family ATPase [Bacteroidales bacterium]